MQPPEDSTNSRTSPLVFRLLPSRLAILLWRTFLARGSHLRRNAFSLAFLFFSIAGCLPPTDQEVMVYTALDAEFSKPIFEGFTHQSGIIVRPKFDTEANKTVGLTEALFAEKSRPRCDLFWNNEILNSIRLEQQGLLEVYFSPRGKTYPKIYRSTNGTWHGFAARARVLIVNTDRLAKISSAQHPRSIEDLVDPRWQGQVGIARPLFGTTATHAACLFASWGDDRAKEFFRRVKENAQIL